MSKTPQPHVTLRPAGASFDDLVELAKSQLDAAVSGPPTEIVAVPMKGGGHQMEIRRVDSTRPRRPSR